jgi:membrane protease YdiL (CAAX protease family)
VERRTLRILQLVAFLAAFFLAWSLRATVLHAIDQAIASPAARSAYAVAVKAVLWVLPAAAFGWWLRGQGPLRYLALQPLPRAGEWFVCMALTAAFLALVTAFELSVGGRQLAPAALLATPGMLLVLHHVASPWVEELLFRGLVMRELLAATSVAAACVLTSLLFVGAHLPFWLFHRGASAAVAADSAGVFLFSLLACGLYARSRSIWPPTLAHVANNLLSSVLRG